MSELLKDFGTYAFSKESLIIFVRDGSSSSQHSFKRHVGIGSSSHDLLLDFEITFPIHPVILE
jgi:hypothetical protein